MGYGSPSVEAADAVEAVGAVVAGALNPLSVWVRSVLDSLFRRSASRWLLPSQNSAAGNVTELMVRFKCLL